MAYTLTGWAGDNAGPVIGRRANELLVSTTEDLRSFTDAFWKSVVIPGGLHWFLNLRIECLTDGATWGMVTGVRKLTGEVYALELTMVNSESGRAWAPGVHLFSVSIYAPPYDQARGLTDSWYSGTFATAVIDRHLRHHNLDGSPDFIRALSDAYLDRPIARVSP